MKVKIVTRRFTLTDDISQRIEKKLSKLDKFFPEDTEAVVKLSSQRIDDKLEISIMYRGVLFRAEETDKDYTCALDRALDTLERQIRKNRTRLEKRTYVKKEMFSETEIAEQEDDIHISKVKKFVLNPMTVEEAILQMNLSAHEFFLFRNAENGQINVVYKRKDNDYGLIEPAD